MDKAHHSGQKLFSIRGATNSQGNTKDDITFAVYELIDELIKRNKLEPNNIISITFSITKDLDACFPASIARKYNGLNEVSFLDCQQMYVSDDIKFCIRLMAQVYLPFDFKPNHPYLRGASNLRPDWC